LLTIFYSFILYPDRVFLNRGNHEDFAQNSLLIYKPCLKVATLQYFKKYGTLVYNKLDELFRYLPLATIVNNKCQNQRLFVVHGGVSDKIDLQELSRINRRLFNSVCKPDALSKDSLEYKNRKALIDMLWSDPKENLKDTQPNTYRNIGKFFGNKITKAFLEKYNFTLLVRSHECKQNGFELLHNNNIATIFSASNYTNQNKGSVLKLSTIEKNFDLLTYFNMNGQEKSDNANSDALIEAIRNLRRLLYKNKDRILADCAQVDKKKTGTIKIDKLFEILSQHVPNIPYAEIKDRLCECDDKTATAKYHTLFDSIKASSKYSMPNSIMDNFETLEVLFNLIDTDGNKFISKEEFTKACNTMFQSMGTKFNEKEINEFVELMDNNKDGQISLEEFSHAFSVACLS
jgi:serine/threonine-protein phosphatase with EF-hands